MAEEHASKPESEHRNAVFDIGKIYLKDASLESPNTPDMFMEASKQPDISIDASIQARPLAEKHYYDVSLSITATAKQDEKTAFLVEVKQAGIFHIEGFEDADMPRALEVGCPNILLPFAREAISDLVTKAGFPQLLLSPINFEALHTQKLAAEKEPV